MIESNTTNNRVMPKKYELINEGNNAKISRFSERDDGMTRASNQTVDEIINKFVNITNSVNKVLRKPPKMPRTLRWYFWISKCRNERGHRVIIV